MGSTSNIIRKWDTKLRDSIRASYTNPKVVGTKPHSVFTVIAMTLTDVMPTYFSSMNYQNIYLHNFALIFKAVCIMVIIWLYIYTFYCWQVYLNLRRAQNPKDKNVFFSESAGVYRKSLFFLALASWLILKLRSKPDFEEIRHQLRAAYYCDAGITILESVVFSIVVVELSRILFPKTFSWSTKTHYAVVIVTAVVMSGLRVAALNFASGHGII